MRESLARKQKAFWSPHFTNSNTPTGHPLYAVVGPLNPKNIFFGWTISVSRLLLVCREPLSECRFAFGDDIRLKIE